MTLEMQNNIVRMRKLYRKEGLSNDAIERKIQKYLKEVTNTNQRIGITERVEPVKDTDGLYTRDFRTISSIKTKKYKFNSGTPIKVTYEKGSNNIVDVAPSVEIDDLIEFQKQGKVVEMSTARANMPIDPNKRMLLRGLPPNLRNKSSDMSKKSSDMSKKNTMLILGALILGFIAYKKLKK